MNDHSSNLATAAEVLSFWREAGYEKWFNKDAAFDAEIRRRFLATCEAAAAGQLKEWESTAEGALALIIVLDQFPRNMFRDNARAFATDPAARAIAAASLIKGYDGQIAKLSGDLRDFFYLPFMHSEDLSDQEHALALYAAVASDDLKWSKIHADIIRKFGRFPHRNKVLGRATTPEEQAFLDAGGFSG